MWLLPIVWSFYAFYNDLCSYRSTLPHPEMCSLWTIVTQYLVAPKRSLHTRQAAKTLLKFSICSVASQLHEFADICISLVCPAPLEDGGMPEVNTDLENGNRWARPNTGRGSSESLPYFVSSNREEAAQPVLTSLRFTVLSDISQKLCFMSRSVCI